MKLKLWLYCVILVVFSNLYSFAGSVHVHTIQNSFVQTNIDKKTINTEQKRKKRKWQERMRQRIHKLIKAHDAFLIAFLISLFLLALCFMLGVYWVKNTEVLNALNYVSLGLVVVTAIFGILWLMTVNMRKRP